jgi:xylulokinase
VWNQIKADVTGVPVVVPSTSIGAPLGDAVIAAVGVGLTENVRTTIDAWFEPGRTFRPRREHAEQYTRMYELYRRIYEDLEDDFDALHAAVRGL